jgi:hypothetical protein
MEEYLMAVNPALWTILNRGITFPSGDATLTQEQANELQRNYQDISIIKSSLTGRNICRICFHLNKLEYLDIFPDFPEYPEKYLETPDLI